MIALRRNGWIGIDVGTSTLKVVQLARSHNRLRIVGSVIIPRYAATPIVKLPEEKPLSSADEMRVAVSLNSGFHGRLAAAVLPMTLCNVHTVDRPLEQEPDQERFVRKAVEMSTQRSAENLQFDVWDAEAGDEGKRATRSNVLSVPRNWSDQLCEDVTQSGWSCQAIDGLPFALARAVSMVQPRGDASPVAALDWGYGRATFCVIVDNRPVYVRCFKECGFHRILSTLRENLNVTPEEAQTLLHDYGIAEDSNDVSIGSGEVIRRIITEPLGRLEDEYKRTISHLQGQRRTIVPKKMYVFGGGGTINGLAAHLTRQLNTKVKIWQFGIEKPEPGAQPNQPSCLFGPAVSLSALAWEQQ